MRHLRTTSLFFFSLCLLAIGGCGSNNNSDFKDSLTFGTGLGGNGFDLVSEGTSFTLSPGPTGTQGTVWFKLGSAADIGNRAVRLYISGGTYATKDYPSTQDYGHYLLSSFRITDTGTFPVKGYLVEQIGPDIGKETFVAESSLTMQP
jgi:hypothetical protein